MAARVSDSALMPEPYVASCSSCRSDPGYRARSGTDSCGPSLHPHGTSVQDKPQGYQEDGSLVWAQRTRIDLLL